MTGRLWLPKAPSIIRERHVDRHLCDMLLVNQLNGFGAAAETPGNDAFTKVLLHCDGTNGSTTITDSNIGGSAHTWTANGNAQISTAASKFGGASLLLDGTGDYISTGDHADFTLSGDFTIDCWVRLLASASTPVFYSQDDGGANLSPLTLYFNGAAITAYASSNNSSWDIFSATTFGNHGLTADGSFHHFAFVRNGNTWTSYVDGSSTGSQTASGTPFNGTRTVSIGNQFQSAGGGGGLNGYIDEYRLSSSARWTSNFTPPTAAYA
jgi:hypothetical protein